MITISNKYIKHTHILEIKFKELLKCSYLDLIAVQTAKLTNISRNTINRYSNKYRDRIVLSSQQ